MHAPPVVVHTVDMTTQLVGTGYLGKLTGMSPQAVLAAHRSGLLAAPYVFSSGKGDTPYWKKSHADRIAREYIARGGWR